MKSRPHPYERGIEKKVGDDEAVLILLHYFLFLLFLAKCHCHFSTLKDLKKVLSAHQASRRLG
jgi:hypothetical protein